MNTPTPEQVAAAIRVAEGEFTHKDASFLCATIPDMWLASESARILAAHIRGVHAECVLGRDNYADDWASACEHIAAKLLPKEGGAK